MKITRVGSALDFIKSAQRDEAPETFVSKEFVVSTHNLDWLQKKLKKIQRAIEKLNADPQKYGLHSAIMVPQLEVLGDENIPRKNQKDVFIQGKRVLLRYEEPMVGEWQFAAKLTPMSDDKGEFNLVQASPGWEGKIPEQYRHELPKCDVCSTKRRRLEVFLLSHPEKGFMCVGRNCLGDLLGSPSAERIAAIADMLHQMEDDLVASGGEASEAGEGLGGEGKAAVSIPHYVAQVIAVIRALGWASRSGGGGNSTADIAWAFMVSPKAHRDIMDAISERERLLIERTEADLDKAEAVVEWARGLREHGGEDLNDYLWNLTAASSQPVVTTKTMGLVASAPNAYEKATSPVDTSKQGQPIFFSAKVIDQRQTRYGSTMWKFQDENGDVLVWFDKNGEMTPALEEAKKKGATVYGRGVFVKKSVYQGAEQIQIQVQELLDEQEFFEGKEGAEKKQEEMEKARAEAPPPEAGKRSTMTLVLLGEKSFDTAYGTMNVFTFVDELGRKFVWKTNTPVLLEEGKTYEVQATVKGKKGGQPEMDRYDPDAYMITRVKVRKVDGKQPLALEEAKQKTDEIFGRYGEVADQLEALGRRIDQARQGLVEGDFLTSTLHGTELNLEKWVPALQQAMATADPRVLQNLQPLQEMTQEAQRLHDVAAKILEEGNEWEEKERQIQMGHFVPKEASLWIRSICRFASA